MTTTTNTVSYTGIFSGRLRAIWILLAILVVAYGQASVVVYEFWTDYSNLGGTHGPLLAAIVLWLFFRARHRLASAPIEPSLPASIALVATGFAWLVPFRAGLQDLHLLVLPLLLWLAIYSALGRKIALIVAFPTAMLYFALPGWGHLADPLEAMTTAVVSFLGSAVGIPVHTSGNIVRIPEGLFEIAEGCSGFHILVVGLTTAALYGEITEAGLRRRALLIAAMTLTSLACNWIRVFVIVIAGHMTRMRHSLITDHYWFGWGLFAVMTVLFIFIASRSDPDPRPKGQSAISNDPIPWRRVGLTAVLLVAAPALGWVVDAMTLPARDPGAVTFPRSAGTWSGPLATAVSGWKPEFVGEHRMAVAVYSRGNEIVEAARIVYPFQQQGTELVSDSNSLVGAGMREASAAVRVNTKAGVYREVEAQDRDGGRFLIRSVYDIGGHEFAVPLFSQLWYGVRSLGGPPVSMLFAVRTQCEETCESARARLDAFIADVGTRR